MEKDEERAKELTLRVEGGGGGRGSEGEDGWEGVLANV